MRPAPVAAARRNARERPGRPAPCRTGRGPCPPTGWPGPCRRTQPWLPPGAMAARRVPLALPNLPVENPCRRTPRRPGARSGSGPPLRSMPRQTAAGLIPCCRPDPRSARRSTPRSAPPDPAGPRRSWPTGAAAGRGDLLASLPPPGSKFPSACRWRSEQAARRPTALDQALRLTDRGFRTLPAGRGRWCPTSRSRSPRLAAGGRGGGARAWALQ